MISINSWVVHNQAGTFSAYSDLWKTHTVKFHHLIHKYRVEKDENIKILDKQGVSSVRHTHTHKKNQQHNFIQHYTVEGRRRKHLVVNDNSLKNCERSLGQFCSLNS